MFKFCEMISNLVFDYKLILSAILVTLISKIIFTQLFKYFTQKDQMTFNEMCLPKNMSLHRCLLSQSHQQNNNKEARPLAVIFAWLLAEEKHLSKYKQLWFKRDFDVLIVKVTPFETLLPPIGSVKVAQTVAKVLSKLNSEYNEVVVHGLSAGVYLFSEVLVHVFGTSPQRYSILIESIKGVIMDSMVAADDVSLGMATTLTNHKKLRSFIDKSIRLFHKIFYNFTVKHYLNSGQTFIRPQLKCPGLIFYSRDDVLTDYRNIEAMIQQRKELGRDIQEKCWDESGHVQHYKHHPKEYEQEVDLFLKSLKLKNDSTN